MNRFLRNLTLGVVCSGLGLWLACDSATPTAPSGTVLTITANPSQIGLSGSSQITVIGRRPDGNPLNPGTEIFFSTSRGTIAPTVTTVDDAGVATAVLRGDGRAGSANVTASVSTSSGGGGGEGGEGGGSTTGIGSVSTTVQIGNDPEDRPTLLVTVSPNVLFTNETGEVTIIARNSDGSPVTTGERAILTTDLGRVQPSNPRVGTDGVATATFSAGDQQGTATITAIVGSSEAATTTVTIQDQPTSIVLSANRVTVPDATVDIQLTAVVSNAQGEGVSQRPVSFIIDEGSLAQGSLVLTNTQGVATNTLNLQGDSIEAGDMIKVRVETESASGKLDSEITIRVE